MVGGACSPPGEDIGWCAALHLSCDQSGQLSSPSLGDGKADRCDVLVQLLVPGVGWVASSNLLRWQGHWQGGGIEEGEGLTESHNEGLGVLAVWLLAIRGRASSSMWCQHVMNTLGVVFFELPKLKSGASNFGKIVQETVWNR